MDINNLTPDDWFVAHMDTGDEFESQKSIVRLERLSTGEEVVATPQEVADLIKAKRVFWKL